MENPTNFRPDLLSILMADKKGEFFDSCMRQIELCKVYFVGSIDWETAAQHERDGVEMLLRVHDVAATVLERVWKSLHQPAEAASEPARQSSPSKSNCE